MAAPARHRRARAGAGEDQSRPRRRAAGGAATPHLAECHGRAVQGDRRPFARVASAGRFRMTITYRRATLADAEALDRIFKASFRDTFAHLYGHEDLHAFL